MIWWLFSWWKFFRVTQCQWLSQMLKSCRNLAQFLMQYCNYAHTLPQPQLNHQSFLNSLQLQMMHSFSCLRYLITPIDLNLRLVAGVAADEDRKASQLLIRSASFPWLVLPPSPFLCRNLCSLFYIFNLQPNRSTLHHHHVSISTMGFCIW